MKIGVASGSWWGKITVTKMGNETENLLNIVVKYVARLLVTQNILNNHIVTRPIYLYHIHQIGRNITYMYIKSIIRPLLPFKVSHFLPVTLSKNLKRSHHFGTLGPQKIAIFYSIQTNKSTGKPKYFFKSDQNGNLPTIKSTHFGHYIILTFLKKAQILY
jgi:hypothetical protein